MSGATEIRRAAMNLLARREHARGELVEKLQRRFPADLDELYQQIDRLTEEGLQSDARLAESFIRSRVSKGHGPVKIRMDLKSRGVSDSDMSLAFEECDVDWFSEIRRVAEKKYGDVSGLSSLEAREKARISRFLQQRGFSFDHITSLL